MIHHKANSDAGFGCLQGASDLKAIGRSVTLTALIGSEGIMYIGKTLLAQMLEHLPWKTFHRIVTRYQGGTGTEP